MLSVLFFAATTAKLLFLTFTEAVLVVLLIFVLSVAGKFALET